MAPLSYRVIWVFTFLAFATGCEEHGTDSHTEVFKTPDQVSGDRRAKLLEAHKTLAISVLKFSRPDLIAKPGAAATINVSADGLSQPIDLAPIEEDLIAHDNTQRAVVRKYLEAQLRPFDVRRVRELGLDKLKGDLRFELVNDKDLAALQALTGESKVHSVQLVANLYRVTMVRRPATAVAVSDDLLAAWRADVNAVDAAATETMRGVLRAAGDGAFETTAFSTVGRTGMVRIDAGVVVLPDFLDAVHKAWQTDDDLVLTLPSALTVQFMESRNARLMEIVLPQWRALVATASDPLYRSTLLLKKGGVEVFTPPSATKPASAPATKPETYIVH